MQRLLLLAVLLTMAVGVARSQSTPTVIQDSIVGNVTLTNDHTYLIRGFVYIVDGGTLTIQPGTLLFGESATKGTLIAERGGKLIANGTADQPIVFTSERAPGGRDRGDWGGVVLCGRAPINQNSTTNGGTAAGGDAQIEGGPRSHYGGTLPHDNSGSLQYVRIEFPGIALAPNNEINGLTLGGVGDGTTLDHIQVSWSGDDSFEWFGGTVGAKHLIALRGLDDDFDTDFGFSGKLQFCVSQRDPNIADVSQSNGFESDNDNPPNFWNPRTGALVSNLTVIGPGADTGVTVNPLFARGAHLRRNTQFSIYNSIVMGWPVGILFDGDGVVNAAISDTLQIRNCIWAGLRVGKDFLTTSSTFNPRAWYDSSRYANKRFTQCADVQLIDPFNLVLPDFRPYYGGIATYGADFTNPRFSTDPFFEKVAYRGAFGLGPRWDSGWTNYDPQNTIYAPFAQLAGGGRIDFPQVPQGIGKDTDVVVIRNTGFGPLTITAATITGGTNFAIINAPKFPVVLPTGGTRGLTLRYLPTDSSTDAATLTIATSLGDKMISLSGMPSAAIVVRPDVVLQDSIVGNLHLTADKTYLLRGYVYAVNGSTVTVDPGTVIFGEKGTKGTLIIERGAKLIADGTAEFPIVFTSLEAPGHRDRGDWGGVILCGRAPINQNNSANGGTFAGGDAQIEGGPRTHYGGVNVHDNSGIVRYVRIEFPGVALSPNNEINGLTLGGVGDSTVLDHVQVSYSGDDSYEWFGGTVNAKHLVALRGLDDDWDTDFGFSGNMQFCVSLRDPNVADVSGSNGFESDNDNPPNYWTPRTAATISNFTVVGPLSDTGGSCNPLFMRGAHLRRNSEFSIYNSVIMGWPVGLLLDGAGSMTAALNDTLQIRNSVWAGLRAGKGITTNVAGVDALGWFQNSSFGNSTLVQPSEAGLTRPFALTTPDWRPTATSPLLSGSSFTNSRLANAFFDQVTYRGAFGPGPRWDSGWTNYDPQYVSYSGHAEAASSAIALTLVGGGHVDTLVRVLTNTGNAPLVVTAVSLTDTLNFAVQEGRAPFFLRPGESRLYTLRYNPVDTVNSHTDQAQIQFTFADHSASSVSLVGHYTVATHTGVVEQPRVFTVLGNVPNPFAGSTTIGYSLAGSARVVIEVCDALGRVVRRLDQGDVAAGSHAAVVDGSSLPNGIYAYRMIVNGAAQTHEMMIMR